MTITTSPTAPTAWPAANTPGYIQRVTNDAHTPQAAHQPDPYALARTAAESLTELAGRHDVAVVLGSGWSDAADALGTADAEIPVDRLPGFAASTVVGHAGRVRSLRVGENRVLVFLGRTHLYEGRGVASVAHPVRTAIANGVKTVVLTNGCGGLRADMHAGQPVLISDHLNLTSESPIVGARFVDLTDLYSSRLRELARTVDPTLAEGVYMALRGPHFETPAEIRMFRQWGADLVGMSTALEAIAAREAGAEVVGLSLVTNLAAGMTGEPLSHQEVMETGAASAKSLGALLHGIVSKI